MMILLDYIQQLEGIKGKRDRVLYALSQIVTGYPQEVLAKDLSRLEAEIGDLELLRIEPQPTVVRLATDSNVTLPVGERAKLNVEYTLANGTLVTNPVYRRAVALFRDFDALYDNVGFITSINLDGYKAENATYTVMKTLNGFDIFDEVYTQGLHVVEVDGEFIVADRNGESIGFTFTTDGKEQIGDNWTIRVSIVNDGTEFKVDNPLIAEIQDGTITGLKEGTTFISVRNGNLVAPLAVNVVSNNPPTTPTSPTEPAGNVEPTEQVPPAPAEDGEPETPTTGGNDEPETEPETPATGDIVPPVEGEETTTPDEGAGEGNEPTEPVDGEPTEPTQVEGE